MAKESKPFESEFSVPEVYANMVQVNFSQFEFEITCGLASSNYQGVRPVVNIRMSPVFVKEFAEILMQNVQKYEQNVLSLDLKIKK